MENGLALASLSSPPMFDLLPAWKLDLAPLTTFWLGFKEECAKNPQEQNHTDLPSIHHLLHSSSVVLNSIVGSVHTRLFHVFWLRRGPMQNQFPVDNSSFILHSSRLRNKHTHDFRMCSKKRQTRQNNYKI